MPKLGPFLIFLSAILFGVTILLIAQIYHVNAEAHWIILIWLIGVVPLAYLSRSSSISGLFSILFFIWITFFIVKNADRPENIIPICLIIGVLFYSMGVLHYFKSEFKNIALVYKDVALKAVMVALFLLTISDPIGHSYIWTETSIQFNNISAVLLIITVAVVTINWLYNTSDSDASFVETVIGLGLLVAVMGSFLYSEFEIFHNIFLI